MAKLIIHRRRNFDFDYFIQIDNQKDRIKSGETKTIDLPAGKHTLTVKSSSTDKVDYAVDMQNDNDIKRLEIKRRIPNRYYIILFCVLLISVVSWIAGSAYHHRILQLAGNIGLVAAIGLNIYMSFKFYGKSFIIAEE
jgi:hypothetical protein